MVKKSRQQEKKAVFEYLILIQITDTQTLISTNLYDVCILASSDIVKAVDTLRKVLDAQEARDKCEAFIQLIEVFVRLPNVIDVPQQISKPIY